MKRAIYPLFIFFVLIGGLSYVYPKLGAFRDSDQAFIYDKPMVCNQCGSWMWDGPQAHSCTEVSEETL